MMRKINFLLMLLEGYNSIIVWLGSAEFYVSSYSRTEGERRRYYLGHYVFIVEDKSKSDSKTHKDIPSLCSDMAYVMSAHILLYKAIYMVNCQIIGVENYIPPIDSKVWIKKKSCSNKSDQK